MENSISRSDITPLMEIIEANSRIINDLAEEIVNTYCKEFDDFIEEVKQELSKNINNLDEEKLHSYVIMLPLYCMNIGPVLESVGIREDISKAVKQEQFNTFYDTTTGTVAHRTAKSELHAKKESLVLNVYQRAYRKIKHRIDYAEELTQSIKKVISSRVQDKQIALQESYNPPIVVNESRRN